MHLRAVPFAGARRLLFCALLLPAAPALAAPSPFAQCEAAIRHAERLYHIPSRVLPSIGRVETGRTDPATGAVRPWPWSIDVGGTPSFFDTKAEAVAAVEALQARGVRSIDVGCMQVNLMHHPNAFASLSDAFDPQTNADYAARFLSALHRQTGSWPLAVAYYHSQTAILAEAYERRVYGRLVQPVPGGTPASPYGVWPPPGLAYAAFPPPSYAYRAFTPGSMGHRPKR